MPEGPAPADSRPRKHSLHTRLVVFSTCLTALVVLAAFLSISAQIRQNTRSLAARELAANQRAALKQQARVREELLSTSRLVTENPSLKAALETYRLESMMNDEYRVDLIATIQHEVEEIAMALDQDILIVTNEEGIVIAAADRVGARFGVGADLSSRPIINNALNQDAPIGEQNFAVLDLEGRHFQVNSVPIVLQGYIIGVLAHGDLLDRSYIDELQGFLGGEIVVTVGGEPAASTMDLMGAGDHFRVSGATDSRPPEGAHRADDLVQIGSADYVHASLLLGETEHGDTVTLHILHSLTDSVRQANRDIFWVFLGYAAAAIVVAGGLAFLLSSSILAPLNGFIAFMRAVARSGDTSMQFKGHADSPEVATLNEAYRQVVGSLVATRKELSGARDDLVRLQRLKEGEKMAALGRMLSGAAHEINNPLSAVVGYTELVLSRNDLSDPARSRLDKVLSEGRRVAALVRNLLKVSRRSDDDRKVAEINQVIQDALDICKHEFVNAGVAVESDLCPALTPVLANELEIQQVVLNLLRNAFDALQEAGPGGTITVSTRVESGEVRISVKDDGPGIKNPGKIFEPFFTTKEIGKGTGLGLSICHGIAESHGGRLTAGNIPEGGACFTMSLPAARGERREVRKSQAAAGIPPSAVGLLSGTTVLVIEDELPLLEYQADLLQSMGAEVRTALCGTTAMEELKSREFDIVITDLRMPGGVSGMDIYGWIRQHRAGLLERVIIVTGDTVNQETQAFLASIPNKCLRKPFSIGDYVESLEELIHECSQPA